MARLVATLAMALTALASLPVGAATPPGKVIARAKGSGSYAIAVAHGQVDQPRALYARFTGKIGEATTLVECLTGIEATSKTYGRRSAGTQRLPVKPAGSDTCHVTATAYGSGRIVAEIRAVR
jgi:hypothetical protein